ncbi:PGF-pre-PGF domain-containing protein, partial [Candidatus Woesearchaeota archaeon]|nr:PGF-pre-PGF domain-containing protein [Candidatus Woesearchaeota archaeon]
SVRPCDTAEFKAVLQNPEKISESYNLEISGHPNAVVEPEYIFLNPGEKSDITIDIDLEDCKQSGQYGINLMINAHEADEEKEFGFDLNVENTNIPDIKPSADVIRMGYEPSTVKIPIQNTGSLETTYELGVQGPEWAEVDTKVLTLKPREEQNAVLTFKPAQDIETGKYPLYLSVVVNDTKVEYRVGLTAKLQPPTYFERNRGVGLALGIIIVLVLAGLFAWLTYINKPKVKTRRQKQKEKKAVLKQKAKEKKAALKQKRKEQKLIAKQKRAEKKLKKKETKPAKKSEPKKQVKLKLETTKTKLDKVALEKQKTKLQKELEQEYKSKYLLVDKSRLAYGTKKRGNVMLFIILALLLIFIGAFWNTILAAWKHALAAVIIVGVVIILGAIRKTKKIIKTYKLFLKVQKRIKVWKKGLVGLVIEPETEAKDVRIEIARTKPHIKSGIHYTTFRVEDNIERLKYTCAFKVRKSWFKRKEVPRDNLRLAKLAGQRWRSVPLEQTGEDKRYVYYAAKIRMGTYTLHGKPEYSKSKKKPMFMIIGSLIAIIALIILSVPHDIPTDFAGIPLQEWKQDTQHTINLNKYFSDPDKDPLVFSSSPLENIDITLNNGIALLMPKKGWIGTEQVIFTADDGRNLSVESNEVQLRVSKKLPGDVQIYFAIILSLAALAILYLGFRDLKKRI